MKKLMHYLFLSCLKATELIEKKIYFGLTFREKMQLSAHTSMCKACTHYQKQSQLLDRALKQPAFDSEKSLQDLQKLKIETLQKISEQENH